MQEKKFHHEKRVQHKVIILKKLRDLNDFDAEIRLTFFNIKWSK